MSKSEQGFPVLLWVLVLAIFVFIAALGLITGKLSIGG